MHYYINWHLFADLIVIFIFDAVRFPIPSMFVCVWTDACHCCFVWGFVPPLKPFFFTLPQYPVKTELLRQSTKASDERRNTTFIFTVLKDERSTFIPCHSFNKTNNTRIWTFTAHCNIFSSKSYFFLSFNPYKVVYVLYSRRFVQLWLNQMEREKINSHRSIDSDLHRNSNISHQFSDTVSTFISELCTLTVCQQVSHVCLFTQL